MSVALRDAEGVMLAVIKVDDIWEPDRKSEGQARVRHDRAPSIRPSTI